MKQYEAVLLIILILVAALVTGVKLGEHKGYRMGFENSNYIRHTEKALNNGTLEGGAYENVSQIIIFDWYLQEIHTITKEQST